MSSYVMGFTPLESPAIYGGDDIYKVSFPYRKGGVKASSFLTGFTFSQDYAIIFAGILSFEEPSFLAKNIIIMNYIVETFNLTKEFTQVKSSKDSFLHPFRKKTTLAVDRVKIQIKQGEIFCLLGPNGAGKTTLIKLLCCLIIPTSGTAGVAGYDILKEEEKVKAFIGLVSGDERNFYWRLTGRQNLKFFATLYGLPAQEAKRKIDILGSLFKIDDELNKRFDTYSTGVKQRLAIVRSLLHDPQILFMDEPTKSLDPIMAEDLKAFIKDKLVREQKKTVIFTTHHLDEAADLADRLAIMDKGKIKACGTIDELRKIIGNPHATIEEIFTKVTKDKEIKNVSSSALGFC